MSPSGDDGPALLRLAPPGDFRARLEADAREGLGGRPRSLPPKYFYDAAGCQLFARITQLPEYYLTRAETALLEREAEEIIAATRPTELLEIGGGCSRKTRLLLEAMGRHGQGRYCPIDFSEQALADTAAFLGGLFPWLRVEGILGDFERHLPEVPRLPDSARRMVALLGSTVGNLDPPKRARLFREVRALLGEGGVFLLGIDLAKDERTLVAAYDDAEGVTAEFNRNILRVVNHELGADFAPDDFAHVARWVERDSRIEMWLRATRPMRVSVPALGLDLRFDQDEELHTEISCKFTRSGIEGELREAGLSPLRWLADDPPRFGLVLAAALDTRRP